MNNLDLIVIVIYLIGLIAMGSIFSRLKNAKEMFAAGGKSPWWLSGLSSFMTTFSAGTFVIWGGISYRYGMVGVSILVVIGIAALFVGWFLAGKWKSFGYDSAAEFINDRFGKSLVRFYTFLQGIVGLFTMGGAVYALAVVVTALIPMPEGHIMADPATGNFSVTIASFIICILVIAITFGGGLWAVLMTDALQFIILTVSVLIVVPLILLKIGGPMELVTSSPAGFMNPVNGEFTWLFLAGWSIVFFFKLGGEWAYVQRFVCVPNERDAKKSTYLFGLLYIVSPLIWMIPPMAFRLIDDTANYEEAYILACQAVLPAGMLGLMVAAMCSATASMATTQLNVFAGAFTSEFYVRIFKPNATDKEIVQMGRLITLLLGGLIIAGAILIPFLGTYTGYILSSVAILTGPLIMPTIWGLYSKKIGLKSAWVVSLVSLAVGIIVKIGFQPGFWFTSVELLNPITEIFQNNERVADIILGTVFPFIMLLSIEIFSTQKDEGWQKVLNRKEKISREKEVKPSSFPAVLCGWATIAVAFIMIIISLIGSQKSWLIAGFSLLLFLLGVGILRLVKDENIMKNRI